MRRLIAPAIVGILDPAQSAFIPGRQIEDPIGRFTERFYTAQRQDKVYSILFHDFAKAYDSVSRKALLELLNRIGMPRWVTTMVGALFNKAVAFPILTDPHKVSISMTNGLKQGCPLSPILFNLMLDPLLTCLSEINETDDEAYCDDIGIGTEAWEAIPRALQCITEFNRAIGMRSNPTKTFIITTDPAPPYLRNLLPDEWSNVRITDRYKYLGVLLGPGININDVFMDAYAKLEARIARYMPLKTYYNTQNRVIIANAFLTPIFSYLFRFYVMGEDYHRDAERLISKWLVPARRFRYDHLTANTREAGLAHPLRDLFRVNLATILRKRSQLPSPAETAPYYQWGDGASLLQVDHIQRATYFFHALTGTLPPVDSEQRDLHFTLQERDETPLYALAQKWNTPV